MEPATPRTSSFTVSLTVPATYTWMSSRKPGSYVQYSSIIIYNLAHVEASWIPYEEGMITIVVYLQVNLPANYSSYLGMHLSAVP
jgi:hypothetical protein